MPGINEGNLLLIITIMPFLRKLGTTLNVPMEPYAQPEESCMAGTPPILACRMANNHMYSKLECPRFHGGMTIESWGTADEEGRWINYQVSLRLIKIASQVCRRF